MPLSLNRFFHEPGETGRSYAYLRIAFGVTAVLWLVSLHPFLDLFYGAGSLCPPERFGISSTAVSLIWWVTLAASLTAASGFLYRPSALIQFLGLAFFFRTPCRPDNYGDQIFASLAFLMMFCPRGPGEVSPWLHKTLRFYAGTLYLVPILYRLGGSQWWDGTAAWTAFADPSTSRIWQLLSRNPWIFPGWFYKAVTYGALAYEGSFPFLIWVRRLRLPLVIAGVFSHLGMGLVLDLGLFPLQMIVVLIGCLDDTKRAIPKGTAGADTRFAPTSLRASPSPRRTRVSVGSP
jgi:hypothetical protein